MDTFKGFTSFANREFFYELTTTHLHLYSKREKFDYIEQDSVKGLFTEWIELDYESTTLKVLVSSFWFSYKDNAYVFVVELILNSISERRLKSICFGSNIIDYFVGNEYKTNKMISLLKCELDNIEDASINQIKVTINNIEYYFKLFLWDKWTKVNFFTCINIERIDGNSIDKNELTSIVYTVKDFLRFISNCGRFDFNDILAVYEPYGIGNIYLKKDVDNFISYIDKEKMICYDDIANNIEDILNKFAKNKIYVVSLFETRKDIIYPSDIVNICAAFENQFMQVYGKKYKSEELKNVKKDVLDELDKLKNNYKELSLEYYENILINIKNHNDILIEKLKTALNRLIDIMGLPEEKYNDFPEIMKNARNEYAHGIGNLSKVSNKVYDYTYLLRAIIYMLVLIDAKVENERIKQIITKCFNV